MIDQKKAQSFADKVGVTIANRFPREVAEHLEGFADADDVEVFMDRAAGGLKEELWKVFYLACMKALEVHQARDV